MPQRLARMIATGFYSGLAPPAPGTAGSAACAALWWIAGWFGAPMGSFNRIACVLICLLAGLPAIRACLKADPLGRRDPGYIVIDEWAGMLIALYPVPHSQPGAILCAFILFRLFDILKPGPVAWAERLPGEWGIVADDIVGGLLAALCARWIVLPLAGWL